MVLRRIKKATHTHTQNIYIDAKLYSKGRKGNQFYFVRKKIIFISMENNHMHCFQYSTMQRVVK